jgi:hypothetical protein
LQLPQRKIGVWFTPASPHLIRRCQLNLEFQLYVSSSLSFRRQRTKLGSVGFTAHP